MSLYGKRVRLTFAGGEQAVGVYEGQADGDTFFEDGREFPTVSIVEVEEEDVQPFD